MAGRSYRRGRSTGGFAIVRDVVSAANRAPWWAALLFGIVPWMIFAFAFALPEWIEHQQVTLDDNPFREMIAPWFQRRSHWLTRIGYACLMTGVFFAIRNYVWQRPLDRNERGFVAFLARLLGRSID